MNRRNFLSGACSGIVSISTLSTLSKGGTSNLIVDTTNNNPISNVDLQTATPNIFYRSILNAIDSAEGNIRFYLYNGCWTTKINGTAVRWKIESLNQKATVDFKYTEGVLEKAKISFTPPIQVGVPTATVNGEMVWNTIEMISYGEGGEVISPPLLNSTYAVEQHFRLANTPDTLLQGNPFANSNNFIPEIGKDCPNPQEPTFQTLVREVELKPNVAEKIKALQVIFKPDAKITFSSDNFINLSSPAETQPITPIFPVGAIPNSLTIQNLTYLPKTGDLTANLRNFNLLLNGGMLNAPDFSLFLTKNSALVFSNIDIIKTSGQSTINSTNGRLAATIGDASKVRFSGGANESSFILDDKSSIDLQEFILNINDKVATVIQIGKQSKIAVGFHSGTLGFGSRGVISIGKGDVVFVSTEQSTWGGVSPNVIGLFKALDVDVISGSIPLTDTNIIELRPGTLVKATYLDLNTKLTPAVAGAFDIVVINGAPSGKISPLKGLDLRVKDSGITVTATDPLNKLTIDRNYPYPLGRYIIECRYENLNYESDLSLNLNDGYLKTDITNTVNSSKGLVFRGNDIHFDGDVVAGEFNFGDLGGLKITGNKDPLGRKNIVLDLKGDWILGDGTKPKVTGKITHLGVNITSGNFKLNELSQLNISGGQFIADGLDVDSTSSRLVSGQIKTLALDVRENSTFGIPNSFAIVAKSQKDAFVANDSSAPLTIPKNSGMPYGKFDLSMDYHSATNGGFKLTDGTIRFPLQIFPDGALMGTNIETSGHLDVSTQGITIPLFFDLKRGNISYKPSQLPFFSGVLVASVTTAVDIPFTSPGMDSNTNPEWKADHKDRVVFPITVIPHIEAFSLPASTISFQGNRISYKTGDFNQQFTLKIPKGSGEHDPSALNGNADGNHPDDNRFKVSQEFFTETFVEHRLHGYLMPADLKFQPQMAIEIVNNMLSLDLKKLNLSSELPVDSDGIEGVVKAVLTALSFLLGTLLTGNPVAGAIAGIEANKIADEKIAQLKAMALLRVAERISDFSHNFTFKF